VTGIAAIAGAFAFLGGLSVLFTVFGIDDTDDRTRLFNINGALGFAVVYMGLGGFLVVQAASALGGAPSSPWRVRWPWLGLPLFGVLVAIGQWQANHPDQLPWLFPFVNVGVVSVPSLAVASIVTTRYIRTNPYAWPVSWREWTSGIVYGAIGATSGAAILNTVYLLGMGTFLLSQYGEADFGSFSFRLQFLPRAWGIFLDLTTISVIAPLNEEFWKGMLVAFFFFRRGGIARCFAWGVLAGSGFNLAETFQNSLSAVHPDALAQQTTGSQWWLFMVARAGTATMHGLATGLAALGLYGLFRHRWRFLIGYPAGVLLHATWNALVYLVAGDTLFSRAGPDSRTYDIAGVAGLVMVFMVTVTMLWVLPGQLRDEAPAPLYRLLGMLPRRREAAVPSLSVAEAAPVFAQISGP
jgi:PrsW family intramembrane metalloprotease